MGKKSRAKRQREKRPTLPMQMTTQTAQPAFRLSTQTESILNSPIPETTQPKTVSGRVHEDDSYIRSDIRRVLVLMAVVASLLTTLFIIDYRTTVIDRVGHKLSSFLDLSGN